MWALPSTAVYGEQYLHAKQNTDELTVTHRLDAVLLGSAARAAGVRRPSSNIFFPPPDPTIDFSGIAGLVVQQGWSRLR